MGWDFTSGATKSDVIKEFTKGWEGESRKTVCLLHCVKGTILWTVMEATIKVDGKIDRWIGCSILGAEKGFGWGRKDMDEGMGPCFYNCPLEYLDMVPVPAGEFAKGWQ